MISPISFGSPSESVGPEAVSGTAVTELTPLCHKSHDGAATNTSKHTRDDGNADNGEHDGSGDSVVGTTTAGLNAKFRLFASVAVVVAAASFLLTRRGVETQFPTGQQEFEMLRLQHDAASSNCPSDGEGDDKYMSFPDDFVWGAATSAFQIEGGVADGGRGPSIWDEWCYENEDNCNGDTGDVADDHYHLWREDVQLMKQLGLKAYRFSISWSRILPDGTDGNVNEEGVQFYSNLIDALLEAGIEPFLTLYHWDLPLALDNRYGGWLDRRIIDDFANYARVCFQAFGDRVRHWITINEAWTVAIHGYAEASNAPGRASLTEPYLVAHHVLLAHARAVKVFREEGFAAGGGIIGIANSGDFRFPVDEEKEEDRRAATRAMEFQLGWVSDPIWLGKYPDSMRELLGDRLPQFTPEEVEELVGSADFIGLNHYSSMMASEPTAPPTYDGYWADMRVDLSDRQSWKKTNMGWNIAPDGAREIVKWVDARYSHPLIYITENGVSTYEPTLDYSVNDKDRRDFLKDYIRGFGEATEAGVNLGGYFAWSLMDNFEWQYGYSQRFGMVHVNYTTLERTPKLSAKWYRNTIECNGGNIPKME